MCEDVHHFNAELLSWLARTGPGATLGESFDTIVTNVRVGDEVCGLRGESTREGVATYLERALSGESAFVVVPSKSGVMHRISVGSTDRIRGFYLYASHVYTESQAIAAADGTAFGWKDVCFKLLDALALLHSRGHQRLRALPNVGGVGAWRIAVLLSEAFLPENLPPGGFPRLDSAVFTYTEASRFRVGNVKVGPETPLNVIAHEILAGATDQGLGIDWAYAGWYAELVAESRRLGQLPVRDADTDFPYGSSWEIWRGVAFPLPPAPVSGTRIGFSDVFPVPHAEEWVAPFPTGRIPVDFDPTKVRDFSGLVAGFDGVGGEFLWLWAIVGAKCYRRIEGRWLPYPDSTALARTTKVPVSYRFIKSFDFLAAQKRRPDWDFAQRMRVFSSPLTDVDED